MQRRIFWFGIVLVACFCAVVAQLDNLQGISAQNLRNRSGNPALLRAFYADPRGTIRSADGVILAVSKRNPDGSSVFKWVRDYPEGPLFAQIVGYDSLDYGNYVGVEAAYNSVLEYKAPPVTSLADLFTTPQGTSTVSLTLSDKLQRAAQAALGGRDGAVVVLDPTTGDILAMYSNPTFDPNGLVSLSGTTEQQTWDHCCATQASAQDAEGNYRGVSLAYSFGQHPGYPGSTFKVITTAAAYDKDPVLVNQAYPVERCAQSGSAFGDIPGVNPPLCNDLGVPCGGTIADMLPESCDPGYGLLGVELGAGTLSEEASQFGFGQRIPIDIPGVRTSIYASPGEIAADPAFVAYSAIGQDYVQATPLEMAMVAGAIGNNGVIMRPHVMAEVLGPQGNVTERYVPRPWLRATSPATARAVLGLMEQVASKPPPDGGTAYGIFPASWQVAVKTGTAQTGNSAHNTIDWMIGVAPASRPQVAIAVEVPGQSVTATGASVAGPIFYDMLQAILGPGQ